MKKKNEITIGDFVSVIDDDLSGYVIEIENNDVRIETTDGFEVLFKLSELVKIDNSLLSKSAFRKQSIQNVLSEKSSIRPKRNIKVKNRSKYIPPMEVDLHIDKLVGSTKKMSNHDMLLLQLEVAKKRLDFAFFKHIKRIIFIHGIGEGVLKLELEYMLRGYDNIKFYPADFKKYGYGATEVYIFN